MNFGFWTGRRVFLTGHTGFKGSWLSLWLQRLGSQVVGYAQAPPTQPDMFTAAGVQHGMRSILGDVCDGAHLQCALKDAQPEVVIHLAAQPLVRLSYAEPVETYATNVMGTVNLLEAVRRTPGVRAVVCVTSDKCYENHGNEAAYRESDPMGGHDPYSSSKGCAELICAAYRHSYFHPSRHRDHGVALATARAGNVIGGGDWAQDRLVPDTLRAFEIAEAVRLRHPNSVRPWQHVLEPLRGYLMLAERLYKDGPAFSDGWNFGSLPEDAKPVSWIVGEMARRWPGGAKWEAAPGPHPHEASHLQLDIEKAARHLAWTPALRLSDALDLVIRWADAYRNCEDMRSITLGQIAAYEALLGKLTGADHAKH
jgi:CDP-glucose 4,6-dehydratase